MDSIADWIDAKPPRGKYTFTREEVVTAFPRMKPEVISTTLSREVKKGRIMIPQQGFYVIIPDEYALRGFAPQPFLSGRHDAALGAEVLCGSAECW